MSNQSSIDDTVCRLANAASNTSWPELPDAVRKNSLDLVTDTIAVIAAGSLHQDHKKLAANMVSSGICTRLDTSEPCSAETAALINGAATTVWQLQDGHRMAKGHCASHLVPALFAVAEQCGASGEGFLSAFVAGYETAVRIGLAMQGINSYLHDAGTWSSIGAAAAVAHLLSGGDSECIKCAINGCASIVPMFDNKTVLEGATMHHLYIGIGAQTAVTAGIAAYSGFTAVADALPRYFGPRAAVNFDISLLSQGIDRAGNWSHYETLNSYIKVHPTCAHLHCVNDAVAWLIENEAPAPEDIESIDVAIYKHACDYDVHAPTNDLAIRFSASASIAVALIQGELSWRHFNAAVLDDKNVLRLMNCTTVRHDSSLDEYYPQGRPSRVTIKTKDGRQVAKQIMNALGDCTNPLSTEQKDAKASELLRARYGEVYRQILDVLGNIDELTNLAELGRLLRTREQL